MPQNDIPFNAGHFIQAEIDSTDFKKSNLASKITAKKIADKYRKQRNRRVPYTVPTVNLAEPTNAEDLDKKDTIEPLGNIASLQPGKNS